MTNQFFTVQDSYKERFYQLPKIFFTNPNYMELSNDAKIAYSLLKDRLELSIKNNWYDKIGNIYFIYTVSDLTKILNCGNKKVTNIKKELENKNLLIQKRQGLNKPNLLYLLKPDITKNDIYQIASSENNLKPSYDKDMSKRHVQKCQNDTSRNVKTTRQEVSERHTNDTDISDTDYIETESNDTNDLNDIYNSTSKENNHSYHTNHQQTKFNNDALKFQILEELPVQIKDYLKNFEIREIRIIKSVLLKGKKSFNNAHDTFYRLENVEFELISVLKRFKAMLLQKHESVEAMQGYLMQSIKAELEEIHALNMRRQNIPKHNIFNQ